MGRWGLGAGEARTGYPEAVPYLKWDGAMSFIWPAMLLLLLLTPLCVGLYLRLQRRRRRFVASYGCLGFVQAATGRRLGLRRHIPPALFLASLTILMIALA